MKNNKIFDAHIHFNDEYKYTKNIVDDLINRGLSNNLGGFLCASFDLQSSIAAIKYAKMYPKVVYAGIAIHPNDAHNYSLDVFNELDKLAQAEQVIAIGETGLDYFYSTDNKKQQIVFFKKHIDLAIKYNKVLQIHIRDTKNCFSAYDDVLLILKTSLIKKITIHCFSANLIYAKKFLSLGCYLNIGGPVTFGNSKALQDVVIKTPIELILVETDAPYLTPYPKRGKVNSPEYINFIVEKIAKLKGMTKKEVIKQTTNNAKKLFDL